MKALHDLAVLCGLFVYVSQTADMYISTLVQTGKLHTLFTRRACTTPRRSVATVVVVPGGIAFPRGCSLSFRPSPPPLVVSKPVWPT